MIIHNFFSDVLLSMYSLFETYLFATKPYFFTNNTIDQKPHSFIKKYEFNIGTRVHQIGDYKEAAKVQFPTAIITLGNDEVAFTGGKAASLIQHHKIMEVNEVEVLFNKTTNKSIWVREQQSMIGVTVQINTESQMHAKEIEHQIKRILPVNKYIQFLEFTSFIEIHQRWLNSVNMDPSKHEIVNLFQKIDLETGDPIFCFSLGYKPLIRLNSCMAEISDSQARSWAVTCDFTYHIQLPAWIFSDKDPSQPERTNISYFYGQFEPISENNQNYGKPFVVDDVTYSSRRNYIVRSEEEDHLIENPEGNGYDINVIFPEEAFLIGENPIKMYKGDNIRVLFPNDLDPPDLSLTYNPDKNSITINIPNDYWVTWKPTITQPIIIQFLGAVEE